MKSLIKKAAYLAIMGLPLISLAQGSLPPSTIPQVTITQATDIFSIFQNLVRWVGIVFFTLVVAIFFFAGFKFLYAGGNAEKLGEAKNMLIYAIIATAVGLLAFSITTIVQNFLR